MSLRFTLFVSLLICLAYPSDAQQLTYVQGELLVRFKEGVQPDRWLESHRAMRTESARITVGPRIAEELDVWKIRFDWTKIDAYAFLREVRQDPLIAVAQFNHLAFLRSNLPNDPSFGTQWYLFNSGQSGGMPGMDLQMAQAWDLTTGGVTPGRDTIVLCVIDNGLDTTHPDIRPNLWTNHKEIPNNGVDDDNNGYVDDVHGWNSIRANSEISDANYHGTPVSGIAGARGNNGIGISGVNWNVKLMHVVGGFGAVSEDRILQAYLYPYRQRKRYNETQGKEGAFVVATNASWGLGRVKPEEYPIWCAFYDSLGQVGILNVAATESSQNVDVDVVGDMPTACGSDFLITVNSLDHTGLKAPGGYGLKTIDLGAFGENVLSTKPGNTYGLERGTSFAAPQVSGAIALLYAANCPNLSVLAENDPASAAAWVKSVLLEGTTPTPSLQGITVTGGRLNVYNSIRRLLDNCGNCPPPSKVTASEIKETSATISWIGNDSIVRLDMRWKKVGVSEWTFLPNVIAPVRLSGLTACTDYEIQFNVACVSDSMDYGSTYRFRTDGCCMPPTGIKTPFISEKDVLVTWTAVTAATGYTVRYRATGAIAWQEVAAYTNSAGLRNLNACKTYEFQIRADCRDGSVSAFSPVTTIRTRGCGACLEQNYCYPLGVDSLNAAQEWIARVRVHDFENRSGKNGYANFTGLSGPTLSAGGAYSISLHPGFPGFMSQEYWNVWIDFNQDGVFSSSEIVYDSGQASRDSVSGIIQIPMAAKLGATRMRVVMRFKQPGASCAFPTDFFGEVEDYCVTIGMVNPIEETALASELRVFPNPFAETTVVQLNLPTGQEWMLLEVFSIQGQRIYQHRWGRVSAGLFETVLGQRGWPDGLYFLRGQTPQGAFYQRIVKQTP